ncbi:MAG: hypothetical protein Q4D93_03430 [Porphyromonas sp.]|nr:hypothetical protein [Porphyromonas sp.]
MKIFTADYRLLAELRGGSLSSFEPLSISDCHLRADNALINSGKYLYQPEWVDGYGYTPALLLRLEKVAKSVEAQFVPRYVKQAKVGILLGADTVSDVPDSFSYQFDDSIVLGQMEWEDVDEVITALPDISIYEIRGTVKDVVRVQEVISCPTRAEMDRYVSLLSHYFMLKIGDLVVIPLWSAYKPLPQGHDLMVGLREGADPELELVYCGIR